MKGTAPVIRLEAVTRRYLEAGERVAFALEATTLEVAAGAWTVITGRSGSGKTTLLHLMSTLSRPDSGRVFVLGRDLSRYSEAALSDLRRGHLGCVYQSFRFIEHLPVWQNVTARLLPAGVAAASRRERARELLEPLGLGSVLDRLPRDLSGGEQQRVALARALSGGPGILVADEPTSNVDADTGAAIAEQLRRLRASGTTMVIATHDPALIAPADAHHVIHRGRLLQ